jgi:cytidylate kinase
MGTVVFPGADVKFYLDADVDTRAMRRYKELAKTDAANRLAEVKKAMKKRDEDDSSRALAPLKLADDAIRIDSTFLNIEQVVEVMLHHIGTRAK